MRARAIVPDHLVQPVQEDIEVLPSQLTAIVFHPLAQVEVVVAGHRKGGDSLHKGKDNDSGGITASIGP